MRRGVWTTAGLCALLAISACADAEVEEAAAGAEAEAEQSESEVGAAEEGRQEAGRDVTAPGWDWAEETGGQIREVPFPVYPGATLVSYSTGLAEDELQGLGLQTQDSPAEVLRFYQENAADMRYMEQYDTHFFWRGAEEFDPFAIDHPLPNIQLSEGISEGGTTITMFFEPTGDRAGG